MRSEASKYKILRRIVQGKGRASQKLCTGVLQSLFPSEADQVEQGTVKNICSDEVLRDLGKTREIIPDTEFPVIITVSEHIETCNM